MLSKPASGMVLISGAAEAVSWESGLALIFNFFAIGVRHDHNDWLQQQ
jgi:hypothetical protein